MFSISKGDIVEPFLDLIFLIFKFLIRGLSHQNTQNWDTSDWAAWLVISLLFLAVGFFLIRLFLKLNNKK